MTNKELYSSSIPKIRSNPMLEALESKSSILELNRLGNITEDT